MKICTNVNFFFFIYIKLFCFSPTKAGSKLDMFTNVKSQMTGWLGSGIPIPGLRKTEAAAEEAGVAAEADEAAQPEASSGQDLAKDEDDNSRYIRYGVIHAMRSLTNTYSWTMIQARVIKNLTNEHLFFRMGLN